MKKKAAMRLGALMTAAVLGVSGCSSSGGSQAETGNGSETTAAAPQEKSSGTEKAESQKTDDNKTGEAKTWTDDDSAEITILLRGEQSPDDDNLVIQELERQTGTKINMIYVPAADYDTKLSTLISAGTVPDIFQCDKAADAQDFKEAGLVADMEEVLAAVAPNVMEELKDVIYKVGVNQDGIYMVPNADKEAGVNINLRVDWLRNLGLEMPTDLESFAQVMHAFTYDDPDGNGKDDTFGYSFNTKGLNGTSRAGQNIFGAFGIAKGHPMEMEDGTVTSWVKHPKFLDGMRYLKRLVDDGVCEPDYLSIPDMNMFEKLWNGTSGCIEWSCVGPTNNWMPARYVEDPAPEFGFPILRGPDGKYGNSATYEKLTSGWLFSADSKNLEGAARIANFCMSEEGTNLLYLGVEDVMYKWVDKENGVIEYLDQYTDSATHRAAGGYCYNALFRPAVTAEFRTLNTQTREGVELANSVGNEWAYVVEPSQVYMECGADMDQIINEMLAELLSTDDDKVEEVYERYIKEWENVGGTRWEEEMTRLWKEQKAQ